MGHICSVGCCNMASMHEAARLSCVRQVVALLVTHCLARSG
jgi:hypothetical protein